MRKWISLLIVFLMVQSAIGQSLKKYMIDDSGCAAYFFCDPGKFNISYSEDSSKVYTGDCNANDSLHYGVICVKLKQTVAAGEIAEGLLIQYLDFLKPAFEIIQSAGYGKGHTMEKKADARGIIDYWKDKTSDEWKIKAWTDGKYIAVLYVYASGKLEETNRVNVFLDSFRFPGM